MIKISIYHHIILMMVLQKQSASMLSFFILTIFMTMTLIASYKVKITDWIYRRFIKAIKEFLTITTFVFSFHLKTSVPFWTTSVGGRSVMESTTRMKLNLITSMTQSYWPSILIVDFYVVSPPLLHAILLARYLAEWRQSPSPPPTLKEKWVDNSIFRTKNNNWKFFIKPNLLKK